MHFKEEQSFFSSLEFISPIKICIENLEHNKEDCKKVTREYKDSINVNVKVP